MASPITTHILDTARGKPAAGVPVTLDVRAPDHTWKRLGAGSTDADGRLRSLVPEGAALERAVYRITFDTGHYFRALGVEGFYPEASVVFEVRAAGEHYHVPLLLNPFGYSTYRGS
jgi:5-hydroxyisourate hydrolase